MYEEGLNQETKVQLLQFLEESRESARIEEEERRNLHRQEQKIFTETLNKSYTHKVMRKRKDGREGIDVK